MLEDYKRLVKRFEEIAQSKLQAVIIQDELHICGSLEACLKLYYRRLEEENSTEVKVYPSIKKGKWIYVEPITLSEASP